MIDVKKFYGIGKVTAEKMYQLGIFTGIDLKQKPLDYLEKHFGNSGLHYFQIVRGIHESAVKPNRKIKSVGAERTFNENLSSEIYLEERLLNIAVELEKRLKKSKIAGKTITLKIKYSDFTLQTRSKTMPYFITDKAIIADVAKVLLYQERLRNSVRLLGISIHNLNNEEPSKIVLPQKSVSVQLRFQF
jgi:DNA polymerase-4